MSPVKPESQGPKTHSIQYLEATPYSIAADSLSYSDVNHHTQSRERPESALAPNAWLHRTCGWTPTTPRTPPWPRRTESCPLRLCKIPTRNAPRTRSASMGIAERRAFFSPDASPENSTESHYPLKPFPVNDDTPLGTHAPTQSPEVVALRRRPWKPRPAKRVDLRLPPAGRPHFKPRNAFVFASCFRWPPTLPATLFMLIVDVEIRRQDQGQRLRVLNEKSAEGPRVGAFRPTSHIVSLALGLY